MNSDDGSTPWWPDSGANEFNFSLMEFCMLQQQSREVDGTLELPTIQYLEPTRTDYTVSGFPLATYCPLVFDAPAERKAFLKPQLLPDQVNTPTSATTTQTSSPWEFPVNSPTTSLAAEASPSTWESPITPQPTVEPLQLASWPALVLDENTVFPTPIPTSPSSATQASSWEFPACSPAASWTTQGSPAMWESFITPQTTVGPLQPDSWPPVSLDDDMTALALWWESTEPTFPHEPSSHMAGAAVSPAPRWNRQARSQAAGHPRLLARDRRKILRPEKCRECGKGHAYKADLMKHIQSRHPEILAPKKFRCPEAGCKDKVYTRSDRLYRHRVSKHNWQGSPNPGSTRRRSISRD